MPLDLNPLLAPLEQSSPCGNDLSFSSEFDQLQEMRREDDPTLSQGEWVTALKVADWKGVVALGQTLLAERTKDLRVAAWMVDALTRSEGHTGLGQGLELCAELCERYWPTLHPLIDEGDSDLRVGSLNWLLSQIVVMVPVAPLLRAEGRAYSLQDVAAARLLQDTLTRATDASQVETEGRTTWADIEQSRRTTDRAALLGAVEGLDQAQASLARLQSKVDAELGDEGPAFAAAREALANAHHDVRRLCRDMGILAAAEIAPIETSEESAAVRPSPAAAGAASFGEAPANRVQALAQLRMVADFFRRTEPHSPVAYLADKAARWGEMPLHSWLRTVLKDQGALAQMEELLGLESAGDGANLDLPA